VGNLEKRQETGIKLVYSGGRPKNGVAICLKEEWQDKVIEVERKSGRIMSMKLVTPHLYVYIYILIIQIKNLNNQYAS